MRSEHTLFPGVGAKADSIAVAKQLAPCKRLYRHCTCKLHTAVRLGEDVAPSTSTYIICAG